MNLKIDPVVLNSLNFYGFENQNFVSMTSLTPKISLISTGALKPLFSKSNFLTKFKISNWENGSDVVSSRQTRENSDAPSL